MSGQMKGKVALLIGGSSRIGRATAFAFTREGVKVVLADVAVDAGQETVNKVKHAGGEAFFVKTDVSKSSEVKSLVDKVVKKYRRLDYALNNANLEGNLISTADCSEKDWDRIIDINLKGMWLCMKYEIRQMLKQGGGAIVNVSSVAGYAGYQGLPAYCASKGGILQLTRVAALEYAKADIRVNALVPGDIRIPKGSRYINAQALMTEAINAIRPVGRMGKPEEIAETVIWLCSDATSFITGHLIVGGGFVTP